MKESWVKGLEPDQARQVKDAFSASSLFRQRLGQMIGVKADASRTSGLAKSEYDSPNWAYKRADEVGYERAIREIIKLIE